MDCKTIKQIGVTVRNIRLDIRKESIVTQLLFVFLSKNLWRICSSPSWWRSRTSLEKWLTLVTIIASIAIIGLVIAIILVEVLDEKVTVNDEVSLDPESIITASSVLYKMNQNIKPCDDFYQFVCGGFEEKERIPDDASTLTQFSSISIEVQQNLKDIISQELPSTEPEHFLLPNKYYKACMNTDLIEQRGIEPIQTIGESFGGWPLLIGDSWDSSNIWTWQDAIKDFSSLGFSVDYILSFSVGSELSNSSRRIIYIDEASTGLGREYLIKGLNEPFVSAYYDYMVDIAVLFGANKTLAQTEMRESLQFEMELANISLPQEERRNSTALDNKRTLKKMQETYPYVNWVQYINSLFPSGITVDENEEISVSSLKYMNNLENVLSKTPKRTIANYMMWRIYSSAVSFMPAKFRDRQFQYSKVTSGVQEQPARWKVCVNAVKGELDISVGSLYVQKHFPQETKKIAKEMVENIRSTFDEILTDIGWMDSDTKVQAKEKLYAMQEHIGYPDELVDNNHLAEYYNGLSIDSEKYFESHMTMNIFSGEKSLRKFREPVDKSDWVSYSRPTVVNAFYSFDDNSIQFPAAILQGTFFNAKRPKYMNYGSIGWVIGHEITHGFDDQGSQFDLNGNLVDWWAKDTKDAYLSKAQCIIDQYGSYTERTTGLKVNGINTQGENIADNGGLKESYKAYQSWSKLNGLEPKLPGLNYTPEQMFWISAGQTWCSKLSLANMKNRITTGVHSPPEFRVMGVLRNMKQFSEDFQCLEGTPMNPVEKCEVW